MKLKDLVDIPSYRLELPVSKQKVEYRPFLAKEQRVLLQAQQEGEQEGIINSIVKIIDSCTFGKLDMGTLCLTDAEFLLLNLRANSVGATTEVKVVCTHCEKKADTVIDLLSYKFTTPAVIKNTIQLQDNLWIQLRHPSVNDAIQAKTDQDKYNIVAKCIVSIIQGDTVYDVKDQPLEEIEEFIDVLNEKQQTKIVEFFNSVPQLFIPIEYICPHCKELNKSEVKGLADFFG